jgi:N-formylglutamate deformylase
MRRFFTITRGSSPLIATAIHSGHCVRPELAPWLVVDDAARRREEDPLTDRFTDVSQTRIVVHHSRFEVDLNRPRAQAVYLRPEQAWGLRVYRGLPGELIEASLAEYDAFYAALHELCSERVRRCGGFVLFDLHSYNHLRNGPDGPPADPARHPEINVGTGTMNRRHWAPLVNRFVSDLAGFPFCGRHLDVRENVRFYGGHLPAWVHRTFPGTGCALAIEIKKIFMNEWTGEPFPELIAELQGALASTVRGVCEELWKLTQSQRESVA